MSSPNSLNLARLRDGLKPFRLHFFPALRSTSDHAAALRRRGELFAPAVVVAGRQTAGRGRGSNTWFSAAGSLTATFALPVNGAFAPHHLPLAAGLAARDAAAEASGHGEVKLKWPNDLVVASNGRGGGGPLLKLAGLLCERLDAIDLIGIGMNVNAPTRAIPRGLRDRVVYLNGLAPPIANRHSQLAILPPLLDLTAVLIALGRHLHTMLVRRSETPFPALLREYDTHHALVGRRVRITSTNEPAVRGTCQGLDDTGRLLVREGKRLHRVLAGHVELG